MEPRTFRAPNTQSALEIVQNELGAEAIILSVRQVPSGAAWQTWKKPEVEVLAIPAIPSNFNSDILNNPLLKAEEISPKGNLVQSIQPSPGNAPANSPRPEKNANEAEVKNYLTQLVTQLTRSKTSPRQAKEIQQQPSPAIESAEPVIIENKTSQSEVKIPSVLIEIKQLLQEQGLDKEIIKNVLTRTGEMLSSSNYEDKDRILLQVQKQIETYIRILRVDRAPSGSSPTSRVMFVVGPSGAGKTSLCAKLATHYQKEHSRKIAWISADTVRSGAIALARSYTDPLGLNLQLVYTPLDLEKAITLESEADLILVDTPARNPYRPDEIVELGSFLTVVPQKITFLTLPATSKEADLTQTLVAFNPLGITGLVFTKTDETKYYGGIFNQVWRHKIPLAYLTNGTDIFNLHPANAVLLTNMLFGLEA